jgi:hypothetical protein
MRTMIAHESKTRSVLIPNCALEIRVLVCCINKIDNLIC